MAGRDAGDAQFKALQLVWWDRAHDRAHGLQPVATLGGAAGRDRRRHAADLCFAARAHSEWVTKAGGGGRDGLRADGARLSSYGELLRTERAVGAHAAIQRRVLLGRNRAFRNKLLARRRRPVEGKSAGQVLRAEAMFVMSAGIPSRLRGCG